MLIVVINGNIILVTKGIYLKNNLSLCSGVSCFRCFITFILFKIHIILNLIDIIRFVNIEIY